jgi:hypothetical protein
MNTTYGKGKYQAEVLEQGFTTARTTGTAGFFLQLKILGRYDGEGKLQECPQFERTVTQYLANDTGVKILRDDLKALGVRITALEQLNPAEPGHVSLVGRKIDVDCKVEVYQGRQRERWDIRRSQNTLNSAEVRALGDQYNPLLRDGNGQASPGPAPSPAPNDSDVPF